MSGLILGRGSNSSLPSYGFVSRARPEKSTDLITYSGDGHLITFAPTGTGKTSSSVITNALRHPGQLIVLDIKGEVYKATADTVESFPIRDLPPNQKFRVAGAASK